MSNWNFFTNYAHVLFAIAFNPNASVRDISQIVGITERAAARILSELDQDGFLSITKNGRRNIYTLHQDKHLRHDIEKDCTIGDMLALIKKARKRS